MKIYPVAHMRTNAHALELSEQILASGADGAFLIDHFSPQSHNRLTVAYQHVRQRLGREAFIGVNYLALSPLDAMAHLAASLRSGIIESMPDALWFDDVTRFDVRNLSDTKKYYGMEDVDCFGGIAFKYTSQSTDDPELAAQWARQYASRVDVVTTSGAGTGFAADPAKVRAMKEAIGDQRLALASGISIENIKDYEEYVYAGLVSSSIETYKYSGEFVPEKLQQIVDVAHRR